MILSLYSILGSNTLFLISLFFQKNFQIPLLKNFNNKIIEYYNKKIKEISINIKEEKAYNNILDIIEEEEEVGKDYVLKEKLKINKMNLNYKYRFSSKNNDV